MAWLKIGLTRNRNENQKRELAKLNFNITIPSYKLRSVAVVIWRQICKRNVISSVAVESSRCNQRRLTGPCGTLYVRMF
jgi:hypothetical protein